MTVLSRRAWRFIILLGFVSLFADMTYEGARSVVGPFLGLLGASAAVVGIVSGAGELIGYALRLPAGYFADRSRRYWPMTIAGYAINLFSVPLLALAGRWEIAAGLIVAERAGRALRKPSTDAMLSHAVSSTGSGWGFGVREAMDQTGAVLGPIGVAIVLARHAGYSWAFALLVIPAVLALITLLIGRRLYASPEHLDIKRPTITSTAGMRRAFWIYVIAGACLAAGTVDFPLAAYHLARGAVVPVARLPLLYAIAMGAAAVTAPIVGRIYDRFGLVVVAAASLIPAAATPLLFLGGASAAALGVALWGVGMGVQEATVRAAVGDLTPSDRRASAYGVFDAVFGVAWFAGSALMGILYGVHAEALVVFSVTAQLCAVLALALAARGRAPAR